jgi:uncharacterized integral membrane protein
MVSQTQIGGNGRTGETATSRLGGLTHDVIELIELQTKLFVADCKEAVGRLLTTVTLLLLALMVLIAALPLIFVAFAAALMSFGLPAGWAFLISAVAGFLIAGGLAAVGWRRLRGAGRIFRRSKREFSRNLRWLKDALKQPRGPEM